MSDKGIQKKTNLAPKPTARTTIAKGIKSETKIVKKSDEKSDTKLTSIGNKNTVIKRNVKTVNKSIDNKSKANNNLNVISNNVKKKPETTSKTSNTLKPTTKPVNSITKNANKTIINSNKTTINTNKTAINQKSIKSVDNKSKTVETKNNAIIKRQIVSKTTKELNINETIDRKSDNNLNIKSTTSVTEIIAERNDHANKQDHVYKEDHANKDSSDEQYVSLATLDSSYQKSARRSSESVLAEPPSECDTEIDEIINNISDNQTNDDFPSDYCDDFEEYESDFEEDDEEDDEEENQSEGQVDEDETKYKGIGEKHNTFMDRSVDSLMNSSQESVKSYNNREELAKNDISYSYDFKDRRVETTVNTISDSVKSAKIRSEAGLQRNKALIRSKELLEMIKLNDICFTNFDLPPINYDVYIKTFGRRDAKQVSCQTTEREEIETQTETLETTDKWSQNPSFTPIVSGSEQQLNENNLSNNLMPKVNPFQLIQFLNKSETLLSAIIASEYGIQFNSKTTLPEGAQQFSTKYSIIRCISLAKKCPISHMFTNSLYLFCVQNVSKTSGSAEKSVISVWSLLAPKEPEKVLICRSHIMSAFSDQNLVVGAMVDGSIALWDLNEQSYYHKQIQIENESFVLRTPSYNTALVAKAHNCPVVAITKLSYNESNDKSIHFASVDENGVIIVWAVNEIKDDTNDLGLSQETNYKITRISSIDCLKKFDSEMSSVKITTFECQPNNWSDFYCGTDNGLVIRCTRHEELDNQLPKVYQKSEMNSIWTKVSLITFNEWEVIYFLVAFTDGFVGYYSITDENPLKIFNSNDCPIIDIKWTQSSHFIAFNNLNQIFVWSLKSDQNLNPVIEYKHPNNRLLSISLWKGFKTFLVFGCDFGQILVFDFHIKSIDN